ncbi:Sterol desaturase/sphingolipid hydroxylase, fatty acid hydroxylase superfamily [Devosia enhydra]|uniref:Sterol desaturase/sphingolipid hydroxylase, fatty acid hydroxylase superfamily n=1 Tax=Devosia enhydra TaxID=665118 RepID=A0A1K2I1K9_9HYPH|nr:sterol desaturase family protein [Devosia enhydra]SFZ86270.1 Sterol desaturase/sphingolipid hydroxylase, fatty acid hydroxylase superfamily [Devosia enhydra]
MTILGLGEGPFRFGLFVLVLLVMAALETWLPRRQRRHPRKSRWTTNIGLLVSDFLAVSVFTVLVPVTAVIAAIWAETAGIGLFNVLPMPGWVAGIVAFVVLDLVIWAQHLVFHKVPMLWRVHSVHHTDHDLDATTGIRFHPVEIVLSILVKAAAVVVLGAPPLAVVLFEAMVNAAALFNHANLRLPPALDRVLRLFVVTPDMHRVHHSVEREETDSNYGFALSIWDRLFSTYRAQPRAGHEGMTTGLAEWQADSRPNRLGWLIALPFRRR